MLEEILSLENVSKNFTSFIKEPGIKGLVQSFIKRKIQTKEAVSSFSFSARRGEIIGLLGPNGAGKTTLMKMMTGIIPPSSGEIRLNGSIPFEREESFKHSIGLVMGQKSQLWWDLPAMDSFEVFKSYYDIPLPLFKERVEMMSTLLKVEPVLHTPIRKLSLGERMKLELMASLLHRPVVLFLDEPTIGLDLVSQDAIRGFLKMIQKEYAPLIILTSHYMEDVKALCQRLVLIFSGKNYFDGPIGDFEKKVGEDLRLLLEFSSPVSQENLESFLQKYSCVKGELASDGLSLQILGQEENLKILAQISFSSFPTISAKIGRPPLEELLKKVMIGHSL